MYYRPFCGQRDTKLQQKIERRKGLTHCALISHKKTPAKDLESGSFLKICWGKVGQQLSTINNNCDDHEWSTIINNYPKLTEDKIGQPLPTIAMIMGGQQLFT